MKNSEGPENRPPLLTIEQAATALAVSSKHLRKEFINKGLLPVIHLGRGTKGDRIDPSDLVAFIESRKITRSIVSYPPLAPVRTSRIYANTLGYPAPRKLKNNRKPT